ncbi:MAG TPA: CPBP family intramembrane metalloprotease [Tepidimicrobium sp.]|nr:CPBP family intramembrane metalloprotease [Tepidimicrobium sp.]
MIKNNKGPSILEANILYLLIGIALITLGAHAQGRDIYIGLLITEYIIVLFPILFFLMVRGYSIKQTLRWNRITLTQIVYIVFIVIFSYPIAIFLNFIGLFILDRFVQVMPNAIPIPSTFNEYLISFLIIALTPGICEEVMFRGIIMSAYDELGRAKAIIYSSILFGIFHFNAQNLLGPIFLGILFAIIIYKTNSLIATIIGHTVNNTIALTIGYVITKLEGEIDTAADGVIFPEGDEILMATAGLAIIALIFGIIVYNLMSKLPSNSKNEIREFADLVTKGPLIEYSDRKRNMGILNSIPIIIVMVLFIILHYSLLFS